MYGKIYKNKDDRKLILISSIIPVLSVFLLLFSKNNITIIVYNICYVVFTTLLALTREIRLFNLSDSKIVDKNNQCEFFAIREVILNGGRVISYIMLLIAGIIGNQIVLNIVMIILTLSIVAMGISITKVKKVD